MRRLLPALVLVAAALLTPAAAPAALRGAAVVTAGLDRPRGLAFTPDGTLYVALVGHGPERYTASTCDDEGCFGASGQVVRVSGRTVTTVAGGLLSMRGEPDGTFSIGAADLTVLGDGRLATAMTAEFNGGTPPRPPVQVPAALRPQVGRVITIDPARGSLSLGASVSRLEYRDNPDGQDVISQPYAVVASGADLYVTDSAANTLVRVRGGVASTVAVFPPVSRFSEAVPDALAVDAAGTVYVGEFTGGGQERGTAWIWRVRPGAKPVAFAKGLTAVSGLAAAPDGSLYATEFTSGHVVRVAPDGTQRVVATGLSYPTGIAISPVTGAIYVANHSLSPARRRTGDEGIGGPAGQLVVLAQRAPLPLR